jgi:hypothetical protein
LGAAETELEHPPHRFGQVFVLELLLYGLSIKCLRRVAVLLQPLQEPCDLVNAGDRAGGELIELGIDLRCCRLRDLTGGLGKAAIDLEAAVIDPAAEPS